jgi:uncharacterized integral membrane protein (TIGR00698 family)
VARPQWIPSRLDAPGIALAGAVGAGAVALGRALPPSPFLSDILVAMVIGAILLNTPLRSLVGLRLAGPEREPDRYAQGLRFTGKWVLRAAIILMGLKVQARFFGRSELALIAGVALVALPSTFLLTHALAALFGVRRPMADLIAGGTMICGASAVNAVAPIAGAHRREQGVAIGTIFLFSVVALLVFRPIAVAVGLDPAYAGLWSGLSVNDLSSAIAVGGQMGGDGGVMAAASKSFRVVLLAPMLIVLALLRKDGPASVKKSALDHLPRFLLGYVALAIVRITGDQYLGDHAAWGHVLAADKLAVDVLLASVSAGIGLNLELGHLFDAGARALGVGGVAAGFIASLNLAMVTLISRGQAAAAALVGSGALLGTFLAHRVVTRGEAQRAQLRRRFETGAPLSLAESARLLDALEELGALEDVALRKVMSQIHPSIGELIPVRESPLPHGEGCRWVTYWEGKSGWALVALCREPGSETPIHAHPHRLIGKSIEGRIEELRFTEREPGRVELTSRAVLDHNELIETNALATVHAVRVAGPGTTIDLQLRGPEVGLPGRRLRTLAPVNLGALAVGAVLSVIDEVDDRPGHGGEGASAGRTPGVGLA